MSSVAFEEAVIAYDALDAALDKIEALCLDALSTPERLALLERNQTGQRRLPALQHELINALAAYASTQELGGTLRRVLADRLRMYRRDAARLIDEAADLGPRRALTGQPLPAKLAHTSAAQRAGMISAEHLKVIRGFFERLPVAIDEPSRADADEKLAAVASAYRPDELQRFADYFDLVLNPDGNFCDADRARRRGITLGPQAKDGMSRLQGYLTPEARAGWDTVMAKLAAPGMCDPNDENPTIAGTPSQEAIGGDVRSAAQRHHDAFNVLVRSKLMSGELGSHHGLPVTIVATVTLEDLQNKTGVARTAGDTALPTPDLIRMAAHAYNYLLVFDAAKRCELYKGRDSRLATPAQRLVLYATERGCSRPGCTVPAHWCQVHHATKDWAQGGLTNLNDLTLACGPDNRLVEKGWRTRKRNDGTTDQLHA